jgi:NAD(P)-dependent dehydrogenase (short-subunit alcohol dehydrogenase family)
MKAPPVQQKKVLVTGCSTGIGAATARYLRDHGWTVAPTARKSEDLERLRADGFTPIELDVADSNSVKRAASETLKLFGGGIGGIVNNAGYGQLGAIEDVSRDALRRQFEANVFGATELANQFIPVFRKQGWGRIVNVSSVLGRVVMPFTGSYCASKFALEAISDALRRELRGAGIAVSIIEPGPILSEFRRTAARKANETLDMEQTRFGDLYDNAISRRLQREKKPGFFRKGPEAVAEKILHALSSRYPKIRYCVTPSAYAGAWISRLVPFWLQDMIFRAKAPR